MTHLVEVSIFDERTIRNTAWKDPYELMNWLRKNGFRSKGEGLFSRVFIKPGFNRVVKFSKMEDRGWIMFAKWALRQVSNPHLPNIPWVKFYNTHEGTMFVAVIEKLAPLTPNGISKITDPLQLATVYQYVGLGLANAAAIERRFKQLVGVDGEIAMKNYFKKNSRNQLARTFQHFEKIEARVSDIGTDIHDGNIMIRKSTNTIVVTDPLA